LGWEDSPIAGSNTYLLPFILEYDCRNQIYGENVSQVSLANPGDRLKLAGRYILKGSIS
jgi:hypothetical protein